LADDSVPNDGTYSESQYENLFKRILSETNELERLSKIYINRHIYTLQIVTIALIAVTLFFWIYITVRFVKATRFLEKEKKSLDEVNQELKYSNDQSLVQQQLLGDANRQLQDSEKKFRLLFEELNEGACLHKVIYSDSNQATDYEILDTNKVYEKITGIPKDMALGKLASELYGLEII